MVDAGDVVSTDLKGAGHRLALLELPVDADLVPEYDKARMLYEALHQAILRGDVLSAHTVGRGGHCGGGHDDGFGQPRRREPDGCAGR